MKNAFYRYRIQKSLLADLAASADHPGLYPQQLQILHDYKDVQFKLQPREWIEEDLKELAEIRGPYES